MRKMSLAVAFIDHTPRVEQLIDGIVRETEQILDRREFFKIRE